VSGSRIACQIQLELAHHLARKDAQRLELLRLQLPGNEIDHAQRAQPVILGRDQRRARVEAHARRIGHQRMVRETQIFLRVGTTKMSRWRMA